MDNNKFIELLIKVLNLYELSFIDKKTNKVIEFTPIGDWEINKAINYISRNVVYKSTKYIIQIEIYNDINFCKIISSTKQITAKDTDKIEIPDNSILSLNKDKLFNQIMQISTPEDFETIYNMTSELFDETYWSDVIYEVALMNWLKKNKEYFDPYIKKFDTIISNKWILEYFEDIINMPFNTSTKLLDDIENIIVEIVYNRLLCNYDTDICYIDSDQDKQYLKECLSDEFYDSAIELFFKSNYIQYSDRYEIIVNDTDNKYKKYILFNESAYDDILDEYYEVNDRYEGGWYDFYLSSISSEYDTLEKLFYMKYEFYVYISKDKHSGEEYEPAIYDNLCIINYYENKHFNIYNNSQCSDSAIREFISNTTSIDWV